MVHDGTDGSVDLVQQSRQNSTANMEMNLREIVVRQMSEMKNSLLGVEGNKDATQHQLDLRDL